MGEGILFGWPIYNVFDEVERSDGVISTGFFHVKTSYSFLFAVMVFMMLI